MAKRPGVFRPQFTEAGADGSRVRRTSAKWAYRFEHRGRTYQQAGFDSQADAARSRDQRRSDVRAGQEQDPRKLTLDGCRLMREARSVDWASTTHANFAGAWRRLFRYFAPADLACEVDDTRILQYVRFSREQGHARNTTTLDLVQLRAALQLAHRKRMLPFLPEFPKIVWEAREQTIAPVQLEQILAKMPAWWRLYFEAAQELGWRAASEVRSRKWEHVDWGPRAWGCCGAIVTADVCACGAGRPGWLSLEAEASKTRKSRLFPMTRKLREILTRARMRANEVQRKVGRIVPSIFVRDDGRPLGSSKGPWIRALRLLGVAPLDGSGKPWSSAMVPHDLRRSALRRRKAAGVEHETGKALAGHSTDTAHAHYMKKGPDMDALRAVALGEDRVGAAAQPDNVVQLALFRKG